MRWGNGAVMMPTYASPCGRLILYRRDNLEVLPMLSEHLIDLVLTDPPYGIDILGQMERKRSKSGHGWRDYGGGEWDRERPCARTFGWILATGRVVVIWGGNYFSDLLPPSMGWIFWDKGQRDFTLADGELAWTNQAGALRAVTVHRSETVRDGKIHPTQKPVKLMAWCLEKHSKPGDIVLDPFMGSGTTGIAALRMGRRFVGIERDPGYFEVAARRLQAELEQGKLFVPEVAP